MKNRHCIANEISWGNKFFTSTTPLSVTAPTPDCHSDPHIQEKVKRVGVSEAPGWVTLPASEAVIRKNPVWLETESLWTKKRSY